jgi:GntR family transcriptional regulator, transcriptional repressor for pyruvate dehydrogenase complex
MMTIQQGDGVLSSPTERSPILRPLRPTRNLTAAVAERLAGEIASGRLVQGARLPTEQAMIAALGVSRTVVREAVAALRAEGLIVTRQGSGAFVASDVRRRPFRIDPDGLQSIADVVNLLELRLAVEVETAGLAAERASPKGLRSIARAIGAIDRAIEQGKAAVDEDFAFHHAIAEATGNAQFTRFLEYLGRFIIPRQSIRVEPSRSVNSRAYLEAVQREHRAIYVALCEGDARAARRAMRDHLLNGRKRYQRLMRPESLS